MFNRLLIASFSILFLSCCSKSMKFNSEIWTLQSSVNQQEGGSIRQKMLKNVIKLTQDKKKYEIIAMLGHGSKSKYFEATGRDLLYILGPERSYISIDSEWLLLWFDENDTLLKYELMTD